MPPASEIQTWVSIIRTDGLAVGFFIFVMVALVCVIRWLGRNVITPVTAKSLEAVDAHITFLNENTKATQANAIGVGQVLSTQTVHGEKIDDIHNLLIVRRAGVSQQQVSQNTKPEDEQHG